MKPEPTEMVLIYDLRRDDARRRSGSRDGLGQHSAIGQGRLFWEWTKRPDIQAKLYPHRDPDKIRRDVDRLITHKLLGIPVSETASEACPDPAILIGEPI